MRTNNSRRNSEVYKIDTYNSIKDQLQTQNAVLLRQRQQLQNQSNQSHNYIPAANSFGNNSKFNQDMSPIPVNSSSSYLYRQNSLANMLKFKIHQIIQICQNQDGGNQFGQVAEAEKSILTFLDNFINQTNPSHIVNGLSPQKSNKKKARLNKTQVIQNKRQSYRASIGDEAMQLIQQIQRKALVQIQSLRIDKINLMKKLNQQIKAHNQQKRMRIQLEQRFKMQKQQQQFQRQQNRYSQNIPLGIVAEQNQQISQESPEIRSNRKSKNAPKVHSGFHTQNNQQRYNNGDSRTQIIRPVAGQTRNERTNSNFSATFLPKNQRETQKFGNPAPHDAHYNNQYDHEQNPQYQLPQQGSQYVPLHPNQYAHEQTHPYIPQQAFEQQLRAPQSQYIPAQQTHQVPPQNISQPQQFPQQIRSPKATQVPARLPQPQSQYQPQPQNPQAQILQQINRLKQQNQRIKQQITSHPNSNLKQQLRAQLTQLQRKIRQYQSLLVQSKNMSSQFNVREFENLVMQANAITEEGNRLLQKKKVVDNRTTVGSYGFQQVPRFSTQPNNYPNRRISYQYEPQRVSYDERPELQSFSPLNRQYRSQSFKGKFSPTQYEKVIQQINSVI